MTALRIFRTARPSLIGAPVLPMSREDERFWRILRARRRDRDAAEGRDAKQARVRKDQQPGPEGHRPNSPIPQGNPPHD